MPASPARALPFRRLAFCTAAAVLTATGLLVTTPVTAHASNEPVSIWLTSTSDSGGRTVTRGLQQQTPIAFSAGSGSSGQVVNVNENTRYQQFTGAGASFTDTAAWLMNSSGALSSATRTTLMNNLFNPTTGIGLDFLRNPMGASDLARSNYTSLNCGAIVAEHRALFVLRIIAGNFHLGCVGVAGAGKGDQHILHLT